jgi:hypothetical protein
MVAIKCAAGFYRFVSQTLFWPHKSAQQFCYVPGECASHASSGRRLRTSRYSLRARTVCACWACEILYSSRLSPRSAERAPGTGAAYATLTAGRATRVPPSPRGTAPVLVPRAGPPTGSSGLLLLNFTTAARVIPIPRYSCARYAPRARAQVPRCAHSSRVQQPAQSLMSLRAPSPPLHEQMSNGRACRDRRSRRGHRGADGRLWARHRA